MQVRPLSRPLFRCGLFLAALALSGCPNPTTIGLQDYGSINGNVVSATGSPIQGAVVSSTGSTQPVTTGPNGTFTLTGVAVGQQTVTASAAGYATATVQVIVTKDSTVTVPGNNIVLTQTTSTPINR
jgi:endo-alpha-N-acetylgalactosaminidase